MLSELCSTIFHAFPIDGFLCKAVRRTAAVNEIPASRHSHIVVARTRLKRNQKPDEPAGRSFHVVSLRLASFFRVAVLGPFLARAPIRFADRAVVEL